MADTAGRNDVLTIVSMAVIASAICSMLHEGVGHGVLSWLRGDVPLELTTNHLTSLHEGDRLVAAGGTLVNLAVGAVALLFCRREHTHAHRRYFLWLLAAFNLLSGAGYFLFSGISGFGDWQVVVQGLPHYAALRAAMAILGACLYVLCVRMLAVAVRPFVPDRQAYNSVGRYPYYAVLVFACIAGAFDPLGVHLILISTIPAAAGGLSGLMWADSLLPRAVPARPMFVLRAPAWWWTAAIVATAHIAVFGRGVHFHH